ncbi:MAG TPA: hypothetical protein PLV06_14905 [Bacteroidales bacterium]|nr:hypothetical protein [Bacteroidales bacterium]
MEKQNKKKVPPEILRQYDLPWHLTDFQLRMFTHLIEWKWKNITRDKGSFRGKEYDTILPASAQEDWLPIYPALVEEVRKLDFKKHRHFGHMASSQAACLNLLFPLLRDKKTANIVFTLVKPDFRELATDTLNNGYAFEYCHESNPLKDHTPQAGTDADVAIAYYNTSGELSLWLIEHKLTEDEFTRCGGYRTSKNKKKDFCRDGNLILSDHGKCYYTYSCHYKYWEITEESNLYAFQSRDRSMICPFLGGENQLWRNQLLGHSIKKLGQFKNVHFSVVHHPDNHDLDETVSSYVSLLRYKSVFSCLTSKEFIKAAKTVGSEGLKKWVSWYSDLYRIR